MALFGLPMRGDWLTLGCALAYAMVSAAAEAMIASAHFPAVKDTVISRCSMCHMAEPVWDGIYRAPKGVILDGGGYPPSPVGGLVNISNGSGAGISPSRARV